MANYSWPTTLDFISNGRINNAESGDILHVEGYVSQGDTGACEWLATATTGLTPSQTPSNRGAAELVDAGGRLWRLVKRDGLFVGAVGAFPANADNVGPFFAVVRYIEENRCMMLMEAGVYLTSGTIRLNSSGASLKGVGCQAIFSSVSDSNVTIIRRTGSNTEALLIIETDAAATEKVLNCTVEGVVFDGTSVCNDVVRFVSVNLCKLDFVSIRGGVVNQLNLTTRSLPNSAAAADTQQNWMDNLFILHDGSGDAIRFGAAPGVAGNTSQNRFGQIHLFLISADGLGFRNCDSNSVEYLRCFVTTGDTVSRGVVFHGDTTGGPERARGNTVMHCAAGRGNVFALNGGVGGTPSEWNNILYLNLDNNGVDEMPVIEDGASLNVYSGQTHLGLSGPLIAANASGWANLNSIIGANRLALGDESLKIISNSANHSRYVINDVEFQLRVKSDGTMEINPVANASGFAINTPLGLSAQNLEGAAPVNPVNNGLQISINGVDFVIPLHPA